MRLPIHTLLTIASCALIGAATVRADSKDEHKGQHDPHAHHHSTLPASAPIDSESLYQLGARFSDENGRAVRLVDLIGQPVLVVMFYGTCKTLCPILIEDARDVDAALSATEREQLRVVLVTFDPQQDTEERLRALAVERNLARPRWTLLRGVEKDIRELAMVLGVQYRRLTDGGYAHSAVLTVLDRKGRIVARLEGLRQPKTDLVAKLHAILAIPASAARAPRTGQ